MRPRNRACDAREGCREGLGAPAGAATRLEGYRRVLCPHNGLREKGFRRSRRDPSADRILPESDQVWVKSGFHGFHGSWFTRFDHAGCESQGSLLGSKLRSEQFRAVAFGRHFKRRSDREGVPDSDRDLRPCVIVARAARRRDRRTLSLEPLDATHGPPVASRETVVSRDLTLTETHQDKDGTQPWESRA